MSRLVGDGDRKPLAEMTTKDFMEILDKKPGFGSVVTELVVMYINIDRNKHKAVIDKHTEYFI